MHAALSNHMSHAVSRKTLQMLILICGLVEGTSAEVVVNGITLTCSAGRAYPANVDVYAFDAERSQAIVKLTDELNRREPTLNVNAGNISIDAATAGRNLMEFSKLYEQFLKSVHSTRPVVRTKSDRLGTFLLTLPDNVRLALIVGVAELEDEPYFYATATVDARTQTRKNVTLDFFRGGGCADTKKRGR